MLSRPPTKQSRALLCRVLQKAKTPLKLSTACPLRCEVECEAARWRCGGRGSCKGAPRGRTGVAGAKRGGVCGEACGTVRWHRCARTVTGARLDTKSVTVTGQFKASKRGQCGTGPRGSVHGGASRVRNRGPALCCFTCTFPFSLAFSDSHL
jgi:hypothetical protein